MSKCVNNFLSTNPTTLILSSVVSDVLQRIHVGVVVVGGDGKPAVKRSEIQSSNRLHNVKYVVQSTS